MDFKLIVVIIAIVILIGLLTFFGFHIYKQQQDATFPPVSSECPDYWTINKNLSCVNTYLLGPCNKAPENSMNFNVQQYMGPTGICEKAKWARKCKATWNGVTNAGYVLQKVCGFE
jgi:hypothetical protein